MSTKLFKSLTIGDDTFKLDDKLGEIKTSSKTINLSPNQLRIVERSNYAKNNCVTTLLVAKMITVVRGVIHNLKNSICYRPLTFGKEVA